MITIYSAIIKNTIAEISFVKKTSLINQRKISSPKVIISIKLLISFVKELISRQAIIFIKAIFFVRETSSHKIVILIKSQIVIKEISFIATSRIVIMNEY